MKSPVSTGGRRGEQLNRQQVLALFCIQVGVSAPKTMSEAEAMASIGRLHHFLL
jgi:hypothetical protein